MQQIKRTVLYDCKIHGYEIVVAVFGLIKILVLAYFGVSDGLLIFCYLLMFGWAGVFFDNCIGTVIAKLCSSVFSAVVTCLVSYIILIVVGALLLFLRTGGNTLSSCFDACHELSFAQGVFDMARLMGVSMAIVLVCAILNIKKRKRLMMINRVTIFLVHGYNGIPKVFNYFKDTFKRNGYRVIAPSFPTQAAITKDGYFSVFDQYKDDLNNNTIIIAHSIGNIMSLKYLYENNITICGYVSLAGFGEPFVSEGRDDLNNVIAPLRLTDEELAKIPELIGKAYSVYSDNDHVVPFDILKKYPIIIGAKDYFISGIGHMGSKSGLEELPEVVNIVNSIPNKLV